MVSGWTNKISVLVTRLDLTCSELKFNLTGQHNDSASSGNIKRSSVYTRFTYILKNKTLYIYNKRAISGTAQNWFLHGVDRHFCLAPMSFLFAHTRTPRKNAYFWSYLRHFLSLLYTKQTAPRALPTYLLKPNLYPCKWARSSSRTRIFRIWIELFQKPKGLDSPSYM